jgi:L-aspartate oxidase
LTACEPVVSTPRVAAPPDLDVQTVRARAWRDLGLVRTPEGLQQADAWFSQARASYATAPAATLVQAQLRSLVTVAYLMSRAALRREESRGGHYRTDFPERHDETWGHHCSDVLQRTAD